MTAVAPSSRREFPGRRLQPPRPLGGPAGGGGGGGIPEGVVRSASARPAGAGRSVARLQALRGRAGPVRGGARFPCRRPAVPSPVLLLTPEAAAVMFATPSATAVTVPSAATVAAASLSEAHMNVTPATTATFPSVATAVRLSVWPTAASVRGPAGVTSIVATAWLTVSASEPPMPSVVAVIVAVPSATAVAKPDVLTVTTFSFDEAHMNVLPGIGLPPASLAVAPNCVVAPREVRAAPPNRMVTSTVATPIGGFGAVGLPSPPPQRPSRHSPQPPSKIVTGARKR